MFEIDAVRQPEIPTSSQAHRRLFGGEEFTLHVWYDRKGGAITEFHIFYGRTRDRRISWSATRHGLTDGTVTEHGFWGRDGLVLPASFSLERFREAARGIDGAVRNFVLERLDAAARAR